MIYLDYPASTPLDPAILARMLPYFSQDFANPHATQHEMGWQAEEAVFQAQSQLAAAIQAKPQEIIFTSGATEANNLALFGLFTGRGSLAAAQSPAPSEILLSGYEHESVSQAAHMLAYSHPAIKVKTILPLAAHRSEGGSEGVRLPSGRITPSLLAEHLTAATKLVSVMAVQNEFGTINPIAELGALLRQRGIVFHVDAAQALGRVDVAHFADYADLISFSAHKAYGPKGIGALYLCQNSALTLQPLVVGGGQQHGMRAGTVPVPLVVGLGQAASLATARYRDDESRIAVLAARFFDKISQAWPDLVLHGLPLSDSSAPVPQRVAGILSLGWNGVRAADLLPTLAKHVAVAAGSACHTARLRPSDSLLALGLRPDQALASLRIGLGRMTTAAELETAADWLIAVRQAVKSL
ncbi:MAG: cysteine desulfurase family protein [Candidatus Symbiobacter sp.]|nr:cysteine desulfurase family protein [Candidatus Symbiobacter sp.]